MQRYRFNENSFRRDTLENLAPEGYFERKIMEEHSEGEWVRYKDIMPKEKITIDDVREHLQQLINLKCGATSITLEAAKVIMEQLDNVPKPKRIYYMDVKEMPSGLWMAICDGKEVGRPFRAKNSSDATIKMTELWDIFIFVTDMMEIKKEK